MIMPTRHLERIDMHAAAGYWAAVTGTPRPHRSTLIRWATRGVRGLRLRAEALAGRWYTTRDDIDDFVRHMTQPDAECQGAASAVRAVQVERSLDELDRMIERKPAGRRSKAK